MLDTFNERVWVQQQTLRGVVKIPSSVSCKVFCSCAIDSWFRIFVLIEFSH